LLNGVDGEKENHLCKSKSRVIEEAGNSDEAMCVSIDYAKID